MSEMFSEDNLKKALGTLVDDVIDLDKEIEKLMAERIDGLVEKRKLMVAKIEREMGDEGITEIYGQRGKALWVTQNRKKVDDKALFQKFGITQTEVDAVTTITPVKFIKVTEKK